MRDMSKGRVLESILAFAAPLFWGSLLQQLYILVDSVIIGRYLGTDSLAAVGVAGPVIYFVVSIVLGITIGFSILVAQYKGASEDKNIATAISTMLAFLTVIGVVCTAVGVLYSGDIISLLGVPFNVAEEAKAYLTYMLSGITLSFYMTGVVSVLRGLGDGVSPLYALVLACFINILLDLYFILVLGWGVEGAALASIISQLVSITILMVYLKYGNEYFKSAASIRTFDLRILKKGGRLGAPLAAQHVFLSGGILILIWILAPFGSKVIAAVTIVGKIELFMTMIYSELSASLTTFVGQNKGKKLWERIGVGVRRTLQVSLLSSVVLSVFVLFFSKDLIGIFTDDLEVVSVAVNYFNIVTPFFLCVALTIVYHGKFNGLGEVRISLYCTLIAFCLIRIPLSFFLGKEYGVDGLWWAAVIGWCSGLIYTVCVNLRFDTRELNRMAVS